jgi:hypothetical protein
MDPDADPGGPKTNGSSEPDPDVDPDLGHWYIYIILKRREEKSQNQ